MGSECWRRLAARREHRSCTDRLVLPASPSSGFVRHSESHRVGGAYTCLHVLTRYGQAEPQFFLQCGSATRSATRGPRVALLRTFKRKIEETHRHRLSAICT